MNIFSVINNIYCNQSSSWISSIDENDIPQPFILQRWLSMNLKIINHVKWLDKYTFNLEPRMFLALTWSVIPKVPKAPFVKYIKEIEVTDTNDIFYSKIRKTLELSDKDFNYNKKYIIKFINENKEELLRSYGFDKAEWKKQGVDFAGIKKGEIRAGKKGLALFFGKAKG